MNLVLVYQDILRKFNSDLINKLRKHGSDINYLNLWVPDENFLRSFKSLIDSLNASKINNFTLNVKKIFLNNYIGKVYNFLIDNEEYEAKLTRIAPMSEKGSNNQLGLFEFNDFFNPGATARLILTTSESKRGAWVPLNSLAQSEQGLWNLYTISEGNLAQKDYVELIHIENNMAYVSGTIKDGDLVIVGGASRIAEGQSIKVN